MSHCQTTQPMRASCTHIDWNRLLPPCSKRSCPVAISFRSSSSVASESRASAQCPWAKSTAGTLPVTFFGRYRLPVTKKPGALSKYTFSTE